MMKPLSPLSAPDAIESLSCKKALLQAQKRCKRLGYRMTPMREKVYTLIYQQAQPVKAYDLLDQLGSSGSGRQPPTIYRALDFLILAGLIHRIEALNAYTACSSNMDRRNDNHTPEFYICKNCQRIEEQTINLSPESLHGFKVSHSVVEHYGLCHQCISPNP